MVSAPPTLASMVYWPALRSLSRRDASWLELPPRYSSSIPNLSLKAGGTLARASGSGGPLTTTLPSFLAAAMRSSQVAGEPLAAGLAAPLAPGAAADPAGGAARLDAACPPQG